MRRSTRGRRDVRWPWPVGAAVALVVLGPALGSGSVLTLDAAFVARIPVPAGVWGLGPELPRRVPLGAVLSWASAAGLGARAGTLLLGAALAVAFVGATRLVGDAGWPTRLASGLVYVLSPLLLTRMGAGQWTAVVPFALLPWVVPTLLRPGDRLPQTFLWAALLGATGSVGGTLVALVVVVGLVAERTRAALQGAALSALAQVSWVVPALVVGVGRGGRTGAGVFATRARGPVGAASLLAGHGFWRAPTQVGGDGTVGTALVGVGLLVLGLLGARSLPERWRWRAGAVAAVGFGLALASAVPGVRSAYDALTRTALGAPLRESQRFLVLTLVWLAPAAALGARRLALEGAPAVAPSASAALRGAATALVPAAAAVALAGPGLWGVGGRLRPVRLPGDWRAARSAVARDPGTVVALPYHRYLDLPVAGGRRVLNPLPDWLGGDVLSSSDPELGTGGRELDDPREPRVLALLARARAGEPVADGLARIGVRWLVVLHAVDWRDYAALGADPGLRPVVSGATLDLLAVRDWGGPVVDGAGRVVGLHPLLAPWQRLDASGRAVWSRPAASGWMRGLHPAGRAPGGLLRLPAGRGPVWFWPSLVVVAGDAAVAAGVVVAARLARRRRV